jgi:hypothetical protein
MAVFQDRSGRQWLVQIDAPKLAAVRSECGLTLTDPKDFEQATTDELKLVDVLWVLCRAQAQQQGVEQTSFCAALVGDVLDDAQKALVDAVLDFFPKSKREAIRATMDVALNYRLKGGQLLQNKLTDPSLLESMLAKLDQEIDAALRRLSTGSASATDLPGSSASVPTG